MTAEPASLSGPRTAVGAFATLALALMRIAIGWHFLYEGIAKLLDARWTAAGYLRGSTGPLADLFRRLASDAAAMKVVDLANIWGLIVVGGCLMFGLLTRVVALCGILLVALYYAAYPPLFQPIPPGLNEGRYLVVSKNLVELLALCVVIALPARSLGLDGILFGRRRTGGTGGGIPARSAPPGAPEAGPVHVQPTRRRILVGLAGLPFVGGFVLAYLKRHGWPSHEEKHLAGNVDAYTGATVKVFDFSKDLKGLRGRLPQGKIGNVQLSRMILGGNLMGGWAHARDLIYVSDLVKAYHDREKIFETFSLAEACGINTILANPVLCGTISEYWRSGGKIQFISDCAGGDMLDLIRKSIDSGACACYVQGGVADELVAKGQFDPIEKSLELIRRNGLPAGIGGHRLQTVTACVEKGLKPDFWMKTLHRTNYWSARPSDPPHDNLWCEDPDKTIAFMKELKEPWIAFKVLAAGAIHPKDAFRHAFAGGADFICVGMYDFQIIEDVNVALDVLGARLPRQRQWCA